MSNLLPLEAQRRVWQTYRARFVIALSLMLIALSLFFVLALVPSYLTIRAAPAGKTDSTSETRSVNDPQAIARAQILVSQLYPVLSVERSPSVAIAAAQDAKPSGVTLVRIDYSAPAGDKPAILTLVGSASRERVAAYRDALAALPMFSSASVPVSALVGSSAGQFSVTVTLAENTTAQ